MRSREPLYFRACIKCKTGAVTLKDNELFCISCGFRFQAVTVDKPRKAVKERATNYNVGVCAGTGMMPVRGSVERRRASGEARTYGKCPACGRMIRCVVTRHGVMKDHMSPVLVNA